MSNTSWYNPVTLEQVARFVNDLRATGVQVSVGISLSLSTTQTVASDATTVLEKVLHILAVGGEPDDVLDAVAKAMGIML